MPSSKAYHKGIEKDLCVALVYQCGIANVFVRAGEGTDAGQWTRVLQSDYRTCETFVRGMRCAGAFVTIMHCDEAGDIAKRDWHIGPGHLWTESKRFTNCSADRM